MQETSADRMRSDLCQLRGKVDVKKVLCTRKVASSNGEASVTYEVAMDGSTSLEEARVIALLLGLEVDMAAHNNALAGGILSPERYDVIMSALRNNYNNILSQMLERESDTTEEG